MTQSGLADALALHMGAHVCVAEESVSDACGLLGDEADAIAKAIPKRQTEFAAGRRAARKALRSLGVPDAPIPAGPDRAPMWPKGTVGSITHDTGLALAVVAKACTIGALGIDLTEAAPLPGQTRNAILTPEEQGLSEIDARAVFAVKECLFKALHPQVKVFFGFDAAIVRPDLAHGTFAATLYADLAPFAAGAQFHGTLICDQTRLVAALAVRA
ncbi:MAG: 4'-phosphopantetheinyl transferase superfamily protein [Silicimonas sp.]|nr:4'-phosphopantetheinyl transferase superfamily protein [Silicimonas sp.]